MAHTGSISQAAAQSLMTVGAASKQIMDLEAALGTQLLERHSRGVRLTAAGAALSAHTQGVLSEVDQLSAQMSDYAAGMVGVVRVWAITSAVTQFLLQDISRFTKAARPIKSW